MPIVGFSCYSQYGFLDLRVQRDFLVHVMRTISVDCCFMRNRTLPSGLLLVFIMGPSKNPHVEFRASSLYA